MNKLGKMICTLLAAALLSSSFIGCAKGPGQPGSSTGEIEEKTDSETNGKADPDSISGNVSFWTGWTDEYVLPWITEFNKTYPDIKVEHVNFQNNDEGNVKVDASLLTGKEIDILMNYSTDRLVPRAARGLLLPINDYLEKDNLSVDVEFGKGMLKYEGKFYSLPVGGQVDNIYINEKMAEDAEVVIPEEWTWEEYKEIAQKLTKGSGAAQVYGSSDWHNIDRWNRTALRYLGGNMWYNDQGMSNFDNPIFKQMLQFKYDMENVLGAGLPMLEAKSLKMQAPDILVQGKAAMIYCDSYVSRWLGDTEKYPRDFKVSARPLPSLSEDMENKYTGVYPFDFLSICSKSDNKDAAWIFVKWMGTEGSKYLSTVGHMPLWKKTDKDELLKLMFGDNLDTIDVDSFKKYVLTISEESPVITNVTAYSQVYQASREEAEAAVIKSISVDQAIANMKKRADEAIKREMDNK